MPPTLEGIVGVGVGVHVGVGLAVDVAVGEGVGVAVDVAVGVGSGAGVGLAIPSTLAGLTDFNLVSGAPKDKFTKGASGDTTESRSLPTLTPTCTPQSP